VDQPVDCFVQTRLDGPNQLLFRDSGPAAPKLEGASIGSLTRESKEEVFYDVGVPLVAFFLKKNKKMQNH
jgi:hypothetical protein